MGDNQKVCDAVRETTLGAYGEEVARRCRASLAGEDVYLPDGLWLSVTENCNFRCIGCYTEGLFKKTYVSPEEIRRMLEGSPGAFRYISLTEGEAFLNPQLCDIIELCRAMQPEAKIEMFTNASIPPRGRHRKALSMIDELGVSIDGACKETYEAIRRGGNFEKFIANVREIVAIRAETGNPKVLKFSFTAMTTNIGELPEVVALAAELGVPFVYAHPMEMTDPEIVARIGAFHLTRMPRDELLAITDRALEVGAKSGVKVATAGYMSRKRKRKGKNLDFGADPVATVSPEQQKFDIRTCQYPYLEPFQYVRAGDRFRVLPCCYMPKSAADVMAHRYGMDYAEPLPVSEVYNSDAFWRFRKDLAAGGADDLCGGCLQARTYPWDGGK